MKSWAAETGSSSERYSVSYNRVTDRASESFFVTQNDAEEWLAHIFKVKLSRYRLVGKINIVAKTKYLLHFGSPCRVARYTGRDVTSYSLHD
jgi:hypothetical protein